MKTFFSKLSSLLLILVGVALLGQFVKCPYICSYIAKLYDGSLDVGFPGSTLLAGAIIFILIGGYSILPSFGSGNRKYKILKQNFESGYAEINISSLEKECSAMLKRVAPLKQVTVKLSPEKENKLRAEVIPVAVLDDEQNLPKIENLITSRLQEFLSEYFGIELVKPVVLKIEEFQMEGEKVYHIIEKSEEKETTSVEQEKPIPGEEVSQSTTSVAQSDESPTQPLSEPLQCKEDISLDTTRTTSEETNDFLKCRLGADSPSPIPEVPSQEEQSDIMPSVELPEKKEGSEESSS